MAHGTLAQRIALSMLKGIGPVGARNLVAYCGGVEALFKDKALQRKLERVPGIGPERMQALRDSAILERAQREADSLEERGVRALFYLDEGYPQRLRHCEDAPIVLYVRGAADLDALRTIAVVGTRQPSDHGRQWCEALVEGLAGTGATIVSGLAYGIDITAHRSALRHGLPTVACLAHGLDKVYPSEHASVAHQMLNSGALVAELPSGSRFVPGNFPARNRIIAGLSDCTVVVESGRKGGSLITADIAHSYDREVFAVPGRPMDARSEGCNLLIQQNKAGLITSANDLLTLMEWQPQRPRRPAQTDLFAELQPDERTLVGILKAGGNLHIDELCAQSKWTQGKVAALLLNMEFSGVVRSLPGKVFQVN
jgi:DNA processing protein